MKDMDVESDFMLKGGTEIACMSTSSDLRVVASYAKSECPMIFRICADTFMNQGSDISWLSMYPSESEVLFPPLTFLKPVLRRRIRNHDGFVIDVVPHIS